MSERRWFNPNVPQTLYVAQFLLYFDAFWRCCRCSGGSGRWGSSPWRPTSTAPTASRNEQKRGYQVAVIASFLPIGLRAVGSVLFGDGIVGDLSFILFSTT